MTARHNPAVWALTEYGFMCYPPGPEQLCGHPEHITKNCHTFISQSARHPGQNHEELPAAVFMIFLKRLAPQEQSFKHKNCQPIPSKRSGTAGAKHHTQELPIA